MINYFDNIKKSFNNSIKKIKKTAINIAFSIKKKHRSLKILLPILKFIYNHPQNIIISFLILAFLFSVQTLSILFVFLLVDSIILSLLVLHTNELKINSRKLSKNILSLFILYFNPIGSILTLIFVYLLYSNSNKFISKILIKGIESILVFIFTCTPLIYNLYPHSKNIKFNTLIDSTDTTNTNTNKIKESFSSNSK